MQQLWLAQFGSLQRVKNLTQGSGADVVFHPVGRTPGNLATQCSPMYANPLVTIIIPCYNGELFLREAIESASVQSYPNVEVIVVDDGSTDSSARIAQQFAVRYVRQQNRGLSAARNLGICESKGEYIVFLDADDRLRPRAVESGVHMLTQHPDCALSVGDHVFISADGSYRRGSRKACLPGHHYEALLRSNFIEMISSVMFRRTVFDVVGGFDTALSRAEDYDLYLRIARCKSICCHTTMVAEYRLHDANASHNAELMLALTLRVLRNEATYVQGLRQRLAYGSGIRKWRRQYGRQLAAELVSPAPGFTPADLQRKLLLLLREYPQGLLMTGLSWINPVQRAGVHHVVRNLFRTWFPARKQVRFPSRTTTPSLDPGGSHG